MADYTVYFEIFGRKMKMTVKADSEAKAREEVSERIKYGTKFYKSEKSEQDPIEHLRDMFKDVFPGEK